MPARPVLVWIIRIASGAIVSLAVAWACTIWAPPPAAAQIMPMPLPAGSSWPRPVPEDWPAPGQAIACSSAGMTIIGTTATVRDPGDPGRPSRMHIQSLTRFGWPVNCLETEGRMVRVGPTTATRETLADVGQVPSWSPSDHRGRRLPVRPIWLGLAVDTAFATVILWILEILLTMRRRIRGWRGQCLKCGYDLRGVRHERCPECGAEVVPP